MHALPLMLASTRVIGWALVHFVWQASLLGLVYAAVRAALPRGEARYRFGMVMLLALALCPLLTIWRLLETAPAAQPAAALAVMHAVTAHGVVTDTAAWAWGGSLDALLPWLVLAWLSGVLLLSLRAWRQWSKLKVLVDMAEPMPAWRDRVVDMAKRFGLRRRVTVLCSKVIATPALVGWWRPVILLPMAVACGFPAQQIELILAHELAHLRRWDPLANLFQVVVETLYFYHPVVHWISRDVRDEREICCDELALSASGGSRRDFAQALAELGELRERHGSLLLAASGGVLLDRVQHLVRPMHEAERLRTTARSVAALLAVALLVVTLRLEWKQGQLQQRLTSSLVRLQSILTALPLPHVRIDGKLPDLAPLHAELVRPSAGKPFVAGMPHPVASTLDALASLAMPGMPPVRIADLIPVRGTLTGRVAEPAALPTASVAPAPVRMRQPIYPSDALMRGIEGRVVVEFGLAPDGGVRDLRVIHAEPAGVFEQAAMRAMRGWKYAVPAAGAAMQRRYRQVLAFTLHADAFGKGASPGLDADKEIHARAGCQVVTGTHICRWPDGSGPRPVESVRFVGPH
ncbi:MAG: TonB family protein [Xanthomonadaceae bacterium]|nr:TonB family protein [Xanthomonadaceae bacterium]